ncbi:sodium/potassium/calcium exchanger 2-like isoform X1 [Pristis pectinata]|uniref:sodium/potassium/calcium exchanger 2-like isoform X1 n=1 Tax=Pristis pectinata TaxID=685728 RepID=UPI00223D20AE|nr:sodium/potassium/calcium exchanger 2-like isoform X1 [Pristis pectinata]XP_051876136.1 sodium/potassium/calcium exchanger 2-like isoform X1 [Pristis pectinata]XP_051876137.1 sodium/potassium/calcium exchanger 2-like isoform X1 [Pristis pectinata]
MNSKNSGAEVVETGLCCEGQQLSPDARFLRKHRYQAKRKLRLSRVVGFCLGVMALSTFSILFSAFAWTSTNSAEPQVQRRTLLGFEEKQKFSKVQNYTPRSELALRYQVPAALTSENNATNSGEYPREIFSLEERRRGAIILHVIGMIYMFIALAIVCDEFFVPSLTVIIDKLKISDDVAGATFMAAGGSAPELFTSLIGVFISRSNVGIGTIVGSAVFNILFVIGMCAIFSKEILHLTWWPLFRDVSFYILDLILLIVFFLDNAISWWESVILLAGYGSYVIFMKFNIQIEKWMKKKLNRNKVVEATATDGDEKAGNHRDANADQKNPNMLTPKPRLQRGGSSASLHNTLMRNSIFQLMINTLDPLAEELGAYGKLKYYDSMTEEGKFRHRASILHKMAKNKCNVDDGEKPNSTPNHTDKVELPNTANVEVEVTPPKDPPPPVQNGSLPNGAEVAVSQAEVATQNEDEDQPLSLAWPDTTQKKIIYLIILPIILPLWITLPDVRKKNLKKYFVMSFLGSITWIAGFSYLMVWWAHQVGETIGITEEIMGLTILAAGTSIPDLITSVIVARKGLGDMAVSSSVGSNIFDITVGLPLPWLLKAFATNFGPVKVSSNGLFCAIVLLFVMLLFVILSIGACRWKMNKVLGLIMFVLYIVFLITSVLLEEKIINCPVTV